MTRKFVLAIAVLALASHASAAPGKVAGKEVQTNEEGRDEKVMDMSKMTDALNKKAKEIRESATADRREARGFEARFATLAKNENETKVLVALDIAAADPAVRESAAMKAVAEALSKADGTITTVTKAVEEGMAKGGKPGVKIEDIIENCKKAGKA